MRSLIPVNPLLEIRRDSGVNWKMVIAPFGIEMFSALDQYEVRGDFGQGKYEVAAPKPHPLSSQYIVQATPSLGIVWIKGLSVPMDYDAWGNSLRAEVDRMADQLGSRYGRGDRTDLLMPGSLWDEPHYWMQGLGDQSRFYSWMWKHDGGGGQLPEELETIYVGAQGYGGTQGAIAIEYASTRMDDAGREVDRGLADLL